MGQGRTRAWREATPEHGGGGSAARAWRSPASTIGGSHVVRTGTTMSTLGRAWVGVGAGSESTPRQERGWAALWAEGSVAHLGRHERDDARVCLRPQPPGGGESAGEPAQSPEGSPPSVPSPLIPPAGPAHRGAPAHQTLCCTSLIHSADSPFAALRTDRRSLSVSSISTRNCSSRRAFLAARSGSPELGERRGARLVRGHGGRGVRWAARVKSGEESVPPHWGRLRSPTVHKRRFQSSQRVENGPTNVHSGLPRPERGYWEGRESSPSVNSASMRFPRTISASPAPHDASTEAPFVTALPTVFAPGRPILMVAATGPGQPPAGKAGWPSQLARGDHGGRKRACVRGAGSFPTEQSEATRKIGGFSERRRAPKEERGEAESRHKAPCGPPRGLIPRLERAAAVENRTTRLGPFFNCQGSPHARGAPLDV